MAKTHKLADLQLAIMQVLWDQGKATVAEVRQALMPDRELAHTTVGTMLSKMEEKGFVTHSNDGRANIYEAKLQQHRVNRSMVDDLANRLFGGDLPAMVCHLLEGRDVSADELDKMKKLISEKEKELRNE